MPTAIEANTDSRQQGGDNAKSSLKCKDYTTDTVVDEANIGNLFRRLKRINHIILKSVCSGAPEEYC